MTRSEKAKRIQSILNRLYPEPPIPLNHDSPFTLLIAVLLSAQCTDERVNLVTPDLFALGDTPEKLARVPEKKILHSIRSCGLAPSKSRRIAALSRKLLDEHQGKVPRDLDALEKLPGVGHKTASVVLSQAFGIPAFPVDTHIHRLAKRWGLTTGKNVEQTERDLKKIFPEKDWNKVHLQIIYFGREYCPARSHDLSQCPICSWAASRAQIRKESGSSPRKPDPTSKKRRG